MTVQSFYSALPEYPDSLVFCQPVWKQLLHASKQLTHIDKQPMHAGKHYILADLPKVKSPTCNVCHWFSCLNLKAKTKCQDTSKLVIREKQCRQLYNISYTFTYTSSLKCICSFSHYKLCIVIWCLKAGIVKIISVSVSNAYRLQISILKNWYLH